MNVTKKVIKRNFSLVTHTTGFSFTLSGSFLQTVFCSFASGSDEALPQKVVVALL